MRNGDASMRFEENPARFASNSLLVIANEIDNAIELKRPVRWEAVALNDGGNAIGATPQERNLIIWPALFAFTTTKTLGKP